MSQQSLPCPNVKYLLFFIFVASSLATLPTYPQLLEMVNTHNYYRATVNPPAINMPAIVWAANLSITANNWATRCIWAHSGTPNVGENLYATTVRTPVSSSFAPAAPVNSWGSERQHYNYATNTCAAGHVCGHYTQIVWANTAHVGCAYQDCPRITNLPWPNGGTIVVCQYWPAGNYWGQRPYIAAT